VIRLRRGSGQARDYVVPINFTGRRWIEIPTGEQGWRVKNWGWAIATRQTLDYQYISSISIGFGHIPANKSCSVLVEGMTALAETAEALVNPTITLGGQLVSITGTIATENHFILDPNGTFTVYDQLWNVVFTRQLSSRLLPANLTSFRMQSASSSNIWLEVGVQASNETIANPACTRHGTPKNWLDDYSLVAGGDYEAADLLDSDRDGLLNWQEYRAGTNPTNAASRLVINWISPVGTGQYAVAWQSGAGKTYNLLSAASLISPAWATNVADVVGIAPETVSTGTVATATGFIKVELAP
jgi:hypothetical protein